MASVNPNRPIDVFGVGNALVDTLAFVDDDFISKHTLDKGIMTLTDGNRQAEILMDLQDKQLELRSGGSAANTVWTIATCGGKAAYASKVSDDPNGEFYIGDLNQKGVKFAGEPLSEDHGPTGTCIVLTTPDAQRTMCTHLGVSIELGPEDIKEEMIADAAVTYVEGYLRMGPKTRETSDHAMRVAKAKQSLVAFTFSDPFCVRDQRDDFERITRELCDIVFCNADELRHFIGEDDIEKCAKKLAGMTDLAFVTDSENGCLVIDHGKVDRVGGFPVKAIDTNGAGDAFAGGVLYALTQGHDPRKAGRWGNYLGAQIVQIHGARLQQDYSKHIAEILG